LGFLGLIFTESLARGSFLTLINFDDRILTALFTSVSARTAGFTNLPISIQSVSDSGLLLIMFLMFIGASPGGTGGGIKTTTIAALMAATRATLRGQNEIIIRNRQISDKVVLKAVGITVGSFLFVLIMALLLNLSNGFNDGDNFSFLELLFTCISAFATVGFDLGVTSELGHLGQLILVIGMFVGRLGILLFLSAIWQALYKSKLQHRNRIGYPREDLYV
jgi:Trk-type K+ transport system membrane component